MSDAKSAGRVVGVLFLVQMVISPMANFSLMEAASAPPGYLANAAANATQSVLGLLTVALLIAAALIALFGHPVHMWMIMPMGLSQLALVLWLLIRGFAEQAAPSPVMAQRR